jgi:predicted transcriptional regulator
MKVILPIKPIYIERIFSGQKEFEYRKKIFKLNINTCLIYSSKPICKIVGSFDIEYIIENDINILWDLTGNRSGFDVKYDFLEYFKNCEIGYAIKICNVIKYKKPIKIKDYSIKYAPHNFIYLYEDNYSWVEANRNGIDVNTINTFNI